MKILFPCYPDNLKEVDSVFENELAIAKTLGIDYFFFDHDKLVDDNKIKAQGVKDHLDVLVTPSPLRNTDVVLRGWMLNPNQYRRLYECLKDNDLTLINTPEEYKACHYLPESYKYVRDMAPKTKWFTEWDAQTMVRMKEYFKDKDMIIKDFVKSEKGIPGLFRLPKNITVLELLNKVEEFVEARGRLFNEGIVLREFVDLEKYNDEVNEWRAFLVGRKIAAIEQNSNIDIDRYPIPKVPEHVVKKAASRLFGISKFFTIDFAEKKDGSWIVIETGDGQVSGLAPSQNPIGLYNCFV